MTFSSFFTSFYWISASHCLYLSKIAKRHHLFHNELIPGTIFQRLFLLKFISFHFKMKNKNNTNKNKNKNKNQKHSATRCEFLCHELEIFFATLFVGICLASHKVTITNILSAHWGLFLCLFFFVLIKISDSIQQKNRQFKEELTLKTPWSVTELFYLPQN